MKQRSDNKRSIHFAFAINVNDNVGVKCNFVQLYNLLSFLTFLFLRSNNAMRECVRDRIKERERESQALDEYSI